MFIFFFQFATLFWSKEYRSFYYTLLLIYNAVGFINQSGSNEDTSKIGAMRCSPMLTLG